VRAHGAADRDRVVQGMLDPIGELHALGCASVSCAAQCQGKRGPFSPKWQRTRRQVAFRIPDDHGFHYQAKVRMSAETVALISQNIAHTQTGTTAPSLRTGNTWGLQLGHSWPLVWQGDRSREFLEGLRVNAAVRVKECGVNEGFFYSTRYTRI